jgi:hypothetical protein
MAALTSALLGMVDLDLLVFVHDLHDLFQILALEVTGRTMLSRHDLCPVWLIPTQVYPYTTTAVPLPSHSASVEYTPYTSAD